MPDSLLKVGVCHDPRQAHYGFGEGHPFGHDRFSAFWRESVARGFDRRVHAIPVQAAKRAQLEMFHSRDFLGFAEEQSHRGDGYLDEGDTPAQ